MKFYGELKLDFDAKQLLDAYNQLRESIDFDNLTHQISLKHRPNTPEEKKYIDGVGTLYNYDKQEFIARESDFSEFNSNLKETYFFEVFQRVQKSIPFEIGRVRLMRLKPKSCYSMHQDSNIRLHIPIINNGNSYFVFKEHPAVSLSDTNKFYWLNTLFHHSAMNGCSHEERIHIVFSTGGETREEQLSHLEWLTENSI